MENNLILFLLILFLWCLLWSNNETFKGEVYPMLITNPSNKMLYRNYYKPGRFNSSRIVNVP